MKKIFSFALAAVMLLSLGACSEGTVPAGGEETVDAAADTDELSERVGFEMSVPATAKNVECAVVNTTTGQITFSFNTVIYVLRGSKLVGGELLHKKRVDNSTRTQVSIGQRATVDLYTDRDGGRIAQWYINGTNYTLTSQKDVSNDALTELCDLLIPPTDNESESEN